MKSAVLTVARMENAYLEEWVKYHLDLGFDHIFICDNNMGNEEEILSFLEHVLESQTLERVTVFNHRGDVCVRRQMKYYSEHIWKLKNEYDWIACIDVDEFVTFADGSGITNINSFLSRDVFSNSGQILLNWMNYGDSDIVVPDLSKGVVERFVTPADINNQENRHVKCILNCKKLQSPPLFPNPHHAYGVLTTSADGSECNQSPFHVPNYSIAYIRHYFTKTIMEYLVRRSRGRADSGDGSRLTIDELYKYLLLFFSLNRITAEKKAVATSFLAQLYTKEELEQFIKKLQE